jgi:hypothetical protein
MLQRAKAEGLSGDDFLLDRDLEESADDDHRDDNR